MAKIENNTNELKVIDGTCFVIKNNKDVLAIDNHHQLQLDEIIVANSNTKMIFKKDGIEQVIEQSVPTCSMLSVDGIKVVNLDSGIDFNSNGIKNAAFSNNDINAIHNAILTGQDPTTLFEATAAGNELAAGRTGLNGSSATASFITINYDNDSMLAKAGFDTAYEPSIKKSHIEESSDISHSTLDAGVTITTIGGDNVINENESHSKVPVTGTVDGDVKVGDTVTITVDGKAVGTATVESHNGKLTWTAEVDGSVLDNATTDNVTATVTTHDEAGHSATATDDHIYTVDTDIAAAITITSIATDGVINADEAHNKVPVTGTVGADVKVGDIVTVVVDGQTVGTTKVVEQDGKLTWTAEVDGSVLDGATADSVTATVTTTDDAGNSATATDDHTYNVDTDIAAAITITSIATDNNVTGPDSEQSQAIIGTVGGDVKAGDWVTVTLDGKTLGTAEVQADKSWHLSVDGKVLLDANTDHVGATVTTTDTAGNTKTATAEHNYTVDVNATIDIDKITGDNEITQQEGHQQSIAITGTVGGQVQVGDKVVVTINGTDYNTQVEAGNTWSVNVTGNDVLHADKATATVTTSYSSHNETANSEENYQVGINAGVTITTIGGDNVINENESHSKVPVTGTVDGDVKVGDTVTITVDGKAVGTATVESHNGKLTWTAEVDGSVLDNATTDNVTATVTTHDEAGHSATATDDHIYTVDTDIAAAITITSIATDGVINADEAHNKVPVTGTVGADVKVGDIVTVVVDGQTVGTTKVVEQDGKLTWTAEVDGSVLDGATADSVTATVTTTDDAGNSATATDDHTYNVDTDIAAAITITSIATDNNVTGPDSEQSQAIIGTVGGDVKAGDWVTVTLDGKTLGTAEVQADKSWHLSVDGKVLLDANTDHVGATVTTTDTAGNTKTATAEHNYTVDVNATIDIDKITGDNEITQQEGHQQSIAITGTVGGQVQVGDKVVVTINGTDYNTQVEAGNTWSVNVTGNDVLHADKATATVTTSYSSHNDTASSEENYQVGINAGVTITTIGGDNVINENESHSKVPVTGTVDGDVKVGDTVTITVDGKAVGTATVESHNGKLTWTAEVDGSVLDNATTDNVTATVITHDEAGHSATATDDHIYTVDTDIAAAITITSIATDGVINADEAHNKVPVTGTVGADVKVGDTVTVVVDGQTVGTTKVVEQDGKLTWTADIDGSVLDGATADSVTATVTTTDDAGNSATATDDHPYNVDTDIAAAITITSIATDDNVTGLDSEQSQAIIGTVGGDVKAGDWVTVTLDGKTLGTAEVQADKSWHLSVDGKVLLDANTDHVGATVTTTDTAGNSKTATAEHNYTVDVNATIDIDKITGDNEITQQEGHQQSIAITGTVGGQVQVGDKVVVTINGTDYNTKVEAGNTWSVNVTGNDVLHADKATATVTTSYSSHNDTASSEENYQVGINAGVTITTIGGDNVINENESHSKVPVTGTVDGDVKVGDTVTITVDGKAVGTATVESHNGKLTWTAEVDGSVLDNATTDNVTATVITHDEAGHSATATDDHIYTVDTDIAAAITITSIATDGVINADEAHNKVPVTGTVGADVKVGDTVTVVVDGQTVGTTKVVEQDGKLTWTADIDGSVLDGATADSVTATVTTTDDAGNSATATDDHPYNVDTDIAAAITITSIATDNNVTGPDSEQSQAIIGTVGGDVKAGDWVTVTLDGKTLGTAEVQADKSWHLSVDGKVLLDANTDHVGATVTTTDTAGNSKTATAEHNYTVDVNATIDIDKITGDNEITQQEGHQQSIAITGTVGGQVQVGDKVVVTINGTDYNTKVEAGNTWSVNVTGNDVLHADKATATVTTSYSSHNDTASSEENYQVGINAGVTITTIGGDNVINENESHSKVPVTGTVDGDVKVGDTVTITVDGKAVGTATVESHNGKLTWTAEVDGSVLDNATTDNVTATVTTHDEAGHSATATDDHIYTVDTDIAAAITIISIATDGVINADEAHNKVPVTGTVGADVKVGDTVTVVVDGQTVGTTKVVEQDGKLTWTAEVDGSVLDGATADSVTATVTTTDDAGNSATATDDHPYNVDTDIAAAITITSIATDDNVTGPDSEQSQAIIGTVGGDVKAGDWVTVTLDGKTLGTAEVQADKSWHLSVDGKVLLDANTDHVGATVTTTDTAGNSKTATAEHNYTVDVNATIDIDKITGDNEITQQEGHQQSIAITGTVGGQVQVGDKVVVTINGTDYDTKVEAGNTWSVNVTGNDVLHADKATATVTTSYSSHNDTASSEENYQVGINAGVTITTIGGDNVINENESHSKVPVTGTVDGDVKVGDTVTITVDGKAVGTATVESHNGKLTWTAEVDGSVLDNATTDNVTATVTTHDEAGHSATATDDHIYTVDTDIAAAITITSIATDGVINADEAHNKVPVTGTVGADVKVGDTVTVVVDGQTVGTTKVVEQDGKLTWTAEVDGSVLDGATADSVTATVTTTDDAGNSATATDDHTYNVDTDIAAAITITSIATDNNVTGPDSEQSQAIIGTVGGDVKAGDWVTVTLDGKTLGTAEVQADKSWHLSVDGKVLLDANTDHVGATVTTTDTAGNTKTATAEHNYTVDVNATIDIDKITGDNEITQQEGHQQSIAITGTVGGQVQVGDKVVVTINGTDYNTKVEAGNTWSVNVTGNDVLHADKATATVTTSYSSHNDTASSEENYQVGINAGVTITTIGGDNVINENESHSKVPVTGTVDGDVKVGDTVTITVDGKAVGTATVESHNGKLTWTAEVDGSVLDNATTDNVTATVTTHDEAGHSATATDDHIYTVDTDIAAVITITSIATDGVINADEAHNKVPVTGTVGADVKVGDTVTVVVDGQTVGTTKVVEQDGKLTWTAEVDGSVLDGATADSVTATVTTTDDAGNSATATDDHPYNVDTDIAAAITITSIATDDNVTGPDSEQSQAIIGTVGGDVKAGDWVTVTLDGKTLGTAEVQADKSWHLSVDGKVLLDANTDHVGATVTTTDTAGNSKTATAEHHYTVDVNATIDIDKITGDNEITQQEGHQQSIAITGTVGGQVQVGDKVVVTINGTDYDTKVEAGNTWSVNVTGNDVLHADKATATVTTSYSSHNDTASSEENYQVGINAGVTITTIGGDNVINENESHSKVPVTGTVDGDVKVGDTVTITVDGKAVGTATVESHNGKLTWTANVDGSVLDNATTDNVTATVTTHDEAGHSATATDDHIYTVDTDIAAAITITSIATDGVINADEAHNKVPVTGTVGADVKVGDTVTVVVDGQTVGTTKVVEQDGKLTWTAEVDGSVLDGATADSVTATVTTTDDAGNSATATDDHPYNVDTDIAAAITITSIATDDNVTGPDSEQSQAIIGTVGGDVKAGDWVTVTLDGKTLGTAEVQADKSWHLSVDGKVLLDANTDHVGATVTTTDTAGNSKTATAEHNYTVDVNATIDIDKITGDNEITQQEGHQQSIAITGTVGGQVQVGDKVVVTINGTDYDTKVEAGNTWSVNVTGNDVLHADKATATVTTSYSSHNDTASSEENYQVGINAGVTITTIGGDNVINENESHSKVPVTGTVDGDVKVGDTVTITVDGKAVGTATVESHNGKLTWTAEVDGSVLDNATTDNVTATVTTHDEAGHSATATDDHIYTVDTDIAAAITITSIATDDNVTGPDSEQSQAIIGTVGGDVKAGDWVTVTLDGKTLGTAEVQADKSWHLSVDGKVLLDANTDHVGATVTTTDTAGNSKTATAEHNYTVDVNATIDIDKITGDNEITQQEGHQQSIAITGTVGGQVQVGDKVVVTINGTDYNTKVEAGNTWSVNVTGNDVLHADKATATVTTSYSSHNDTANSEENYQVGINAGVTITTIGGDNVINENESHSKVPVTGTVDGDVKVGDTVTITVDGKAVGTATVESHNGKLTWTAEVDGSVLDNATTDNVTATVTIHDEAGHSATATDDHIYTVDTDIAAAITITSIATDNNVTGPDSEQSQAIIGTVGGDVKVGDWVTVTLDGKTLGTAEVQADKSWHLSVDGKVLLDANTDHVGATVTTTDTAGNSKTATAEHNYTVDVNATIDIDKITGDNEITQQEGHQQSIAITGTVGGQVQVGDKVVVTINGTDYNTKVEAGNTWSVNVTGNDVLHADKATATVTTSYSSHNDTASSEENYQVGINAGVTITTIGGDNVINENESHSKVPVTGTVDGDVKVGDTVTITIDGKAVGTATVESHNGKLTWTAEVDGSVLDNATTDNITATVTTHDEAGHSATATDDHIYTVDTDIAAAITITSIATDNNVTGPDSEQSQAIIGTVGGDVKAGDWVTVTLDGKTLGTAEVQADKSWHLSVDGKVLLDANTDHVGATVTTTDTAGNSKTATAEHNYTVDVNATIDIDKITGDNVITQQEGHQKTIDVRGKVGGQAREGDEVTVTINGNKYITHVQTDLTWIVAIAGIDILHAHKAIASVTTSYSSHNVTTEANEPYTVDIGALVTIDSIADDNIVTQAEGKSTVTIKGSVGEDVKDGDTVTLTIDGQQFTGEAKDGHYQINVDGEALLNDSDRIVDASVTTSDGASHTASDTAEKAYQIDGAVIQGNNGDNTITGTVGTDLLIGDLDPAKVVEISTNVNFVIDTSGSMYFGRLLTLDAVHGHKADSYRIYVAGSSELTAADGTRISNSQGWVTVTYDQLKNGLQYDADGYSDIYIKSSDGVDFSNPFKSLPSIFDMTKQAYETLTTGILDSTNDKSLLKFNIVTFSGSVQGNESFHYDEKTHQFVNSHNVLINTYIDNLRAGGGTQFEGALKAASANIVDSNERNIVYFLSDGKDEDSFHPNGIHFLPNTEIVSIAVGPSGDGTQVNEIAKLGAGYDDNNSTAPSYSQVITNANELNNAFHDIGQHFIPGSDTIIGSDDNDVLVGDALNIKWMYDDGLLSGTYQEPKSDDESTKPANLLKQYLADKDYDGNVDKVLTSDLNHFIANHLDKFGNNAYGGNDHLTGGKGNDILIGDGGNDSLNGGLGNDLLNGGFGNDNLIGGEGKDTFLWSENNFGTDAIPAIDTIMDFEKGIDTIELGDSLHVKNIQSLADLNNHLNIVEQQDNTEIQIFDDHHKVVQNIILNGVSHNDLFGDNAASMTNEDKLDSLLNSGNLELSDNFGNQQANTLTADNQGESLFGFDGNDILVAGQGNDILTGGNGNDMFTWHETSLSTKTDTITDFELGKDKIDIKDLLSTEDDNPRSDMDMLLDNVKASADDKGNITLNIDHGKQDIILENINPHHELGLADSASSADIVSSLFNHNAFLVDNTH